MHRPTSLRTTGALVLVACLLLAGCGLSTAASEGEGAQAPRPAATEADGQAVSAPEPATAVRPAPVPARAEIRAVHRPGWSPFATVGGVTLVHPSAAVERVAFHESNHDGARQMEATSSAAGVFTLESRERGTGSRTAVDVVVAPDSEIRAPVTGTVVRAGTYVLYCEHSDDFAVIRPDARPDWEVKILHIDGVRVSAGDRVEAGATVLAGGPTPLPFASQVDEHTVEPSWPHVHIEVVDPSIPDRPSPGGGC